MIQALHIVQQKWEEILSPFNNAVMQDSQRLVLLILILLVISVRTFAKSLHSIISWERIITRLALQIVVQRTLTKKTPIYLKPVLSKSTHKYVTMKSMRLSPILVMQSL